MPLWAVALVVVGAVVLTAAVVAAGIFVWFVWDEMKDWGQ